MDLPAQAVIDATVAIKWLVPSDQGDAARKFWNRKLSAPDLIIPDTVNALWKYVIRHELSEDEARRAVSFFPVEALTLLPSQPLMERTLDLSIALRLPVYGCVYLAAAWLLEVPLVTADSDLAFRVRDASSARTTMPQVLPLTLFRA